MQMRILFLLFMVQCTFAQNVASSFIEKRWALFHPFSAVKLKKTYKKAWPIYLAQNNNTSLDKYISGGKLDAFRHCFMMAAFAQKISLKKIRRLGILHEKANYKSYLRWQNEDGELPDSLSSVMDLYNNEIGFKIAKQYHRVGLEELSLLIIKEIQQGNALMMKRNKAGDYLNCDGMIIDLSKYRRQWNIPKCLVPTNQN